MKSVLNYVLQLSQEAGEGQWLAWMATEGWNSTAPLWP